MFRLANEDGTIRPLVSEDDAIRPLASANGRGQSTKVQPRRAF